MQTAEAIFIWTGGLVSCVAIIGFFWKGISIVRSRIKASLHDQQVFIELLKTGGSSIGTRTDIGFAVNALFQQSNRIRNTVQFLLLFSMIFMGILANASIVIIHIDSNELNIYFITAIIAYEVLLASLSLFALSMVMYFDFRNRRFEKSVFDLWMEQVDKHVKKNSGDTE